MYRILVELLHSSAMTEVPSSVQYYNSILYDPLVVIKNHTRMFHQSQSRQMAHTRKMLERAACFKCIQIRAPQMQL